MFPQEPEDNDRLAQAALNSNYEDEDNLIDLHTPDVTTVPIGRPLPPIPDSLPYGEEDDE